MISSSGGQSILRTIRISGKNQPEDLLLLPLAAGAKPTHYTRKSTTRISDIAVVRMQQILSDTSYEAHYTSNTWKNRLGITAVTWYGAALKLKLCSLF